MEEVVDALNALADAAYAHLLAITDTKYGPVAMNSEDLRELAEDGDYEDVLAGDLPAGEYADILTVDDIETLVLDTDNIPQPVLEEVVPEFEKLHKVLGGFPIDNRRGIAKVMESESGSIDEVIHRMRDRIPRKLLPVLEEALVLREMERHQRPPQDEIQDARWDIAEEYSDRGYDPQEAQNLISICSMGYLDKDGVFDQMYHDVVINGEKTQDDFKKLFGKYVKHSPFAVFVQTQDREPEKIIDEATEKTDQILRWEGSPGFVEVCGKGNAQDVVSDAHGELENEFDGEIYVTQNDELDQYILTLRPDVPIE
ncbi:hypothetical protein C456_02986 [Haloferax volcanii DSM 14919]|uniref:Uncharacterized protein n=1 Tax=Haloferax lucentense (strain DSM 14919 / JCM 9276 / NCIMB 13854 / Aa 2.2) TaxID=1230452 RepID=M0H121_HALL2|nr:hypothetical protein [Haloferax lucentense]ELZ77468.1 hypothetical protein C456_02986 [Haloferax lucentense DSM 14919]